MGLDETDLSRPPEKWTAAMLSFVDYVPNYGPKPKEEVKESREGKRREGGGGC
jgi:hypothetical protein